MQLNQLLTAAAAGVCREPQDPSNGQFVLSDATLKDLTGEERFKVGGGGGGCGTASWRSRAGEVERGRMLVEGRRALGHQGRRLPSRAGIWVHEVLQSAPEQARRSGVNGAPQHRRARARGVQDGNGLSGWGVVSLNTGV